MSNLTIRMDAREKQQLHAWAESQGKSVTDYLKGLIAADMASGTPEARAKAWFNENQEGIDAEAQFIKQHGIPGSDLAIHHPTSDE